MNWNSKTTSQRNQAETRRAPAVILKVENLVKQYNDRAVVNGVSFEVREGEVVGLLGANGAGKTTSFRMSCGLIAPTQGTVILNGQDVTHWPMYRRTREGRLGYLPQDRTVFAALTTEQNLYAAMEFLGYSRSEQKRRCDEAISRFNLGRVRKTKVGAGGSGGLSGGERRRLEIARALLSDPKILLLDEPFANVDPRSIEEMQAVIHELAQSGVAVLITDHQIEETLTITDRSYVIDHGEVLCSGTPVDVLSNEKAIQLYFGNQANVTLDRILASQGEQGRTAERNVDASGANHSNETSARLERSDAERRPVFVDVKESRGSRPFLSLTRRNVGEARRTPSPMDERRDSNRFETKMDSLFHRKNSEGGDSARNGR